MTDSTAAAQDGAQEQTLFLILLTFFVLLASLQLLVPVRRAIGTFLGRFYLHNVVKNKEGDDGDKFVSGLYVHPVKSLRPVEMDTVTLDVKGFEDDRRFMLISPLPVPIWKSSFDEDEPTHRFLTQRQCPRLATVVAKVVNQNKSIRFSSHMLPGESLVVSTDLENTTTTNTKKKHLAKLWDDVVQVLDMGDEAAAFFRKVLDADDFRLPEEYKRMDVRLVQQSPLDRRTTDDKYTPPAARSLSTSENPPVALTDGFPILIATEASLAELNGRIQAKGKDAIPMSRFRPNIVVKGGQAFEEDRWKVISIDGVIFHIVKGCPRCKQSCTDQINGHVYDEPLATLREFRAMMSNDDVFFAQNVIAATGMEGRTISKGASVKVLEWGEPVWGGADPE